MGVRVLRFRNVFGCSWFAKPISADAEVLAVLTCFLEPTLSYRLRAPGVAVDVILRHHLNCVLYWIGVSNGRVPWRTPVAAVSEAVGDFLFRLHPVSSARICFRYAGGHPRSCAVCPQQLSVSGTTGQVGECCIAVGTDVTGETDEDVDNYWELMPVTLNATGNRE